MLSIAATAVGAGADSISSQAAPPPRLVHAAHEFEAQMMKELLKPLTATHGLDGEEGDAATGSGSALGEFASESLGQALSDHGGFGIATSILKELSPRGNKSATVPVTENLHGNTVINSLK
jgi:Rod binding domain-containing protein